MNKQRWEVAAQYINRDGGKEVICILVSASTLQQAIDKTRQYCKDSGGAYIKVYDIRQSRIADVME